MITYIKQPDYHIAYELEGGEMMLHCEVENFSLSVFKEIRENFHDIRKTAFDAGLDSVYAYTQNVRFCKALMDCAVIGEVKHVGKDYSIVEWKLLED